MAGICPKCKGTVEREEATGKFPTQCPHCGLSLKKKSSQSPPAGSPASSPSTKSSSSSSSSQGKSAPPAAKGEGQARPAKPAGEKPTRPASERPAKPPKSAAASGGDDPFGLSKSESKKGRSGNPFADPASSEEAPASAGDLFAPSPKKRSSSSNPFSDSSVESTEAAGGLFASPQAEEKPSKKKAAAPADFLAGPAETEEGGDPFGDEKPGKKKKKKKGEAFVPSATTVRKPAGGGFPWGTVVVLGVMLIGGGVGYVFFKDQIMAAMTVSKKVEKPTGPLLVNHASNYEINTPAAPWAQDKTLKAKSKIDAAYKDPVSNSYLIIGSYEAPSDESLSTGELEDRAFARLKREFQGFIKHGQERELQLGGNTAHAFRGQGTIDGQLLETETVVANHQGLNYQITIAAPAEVFNADLSKLQSYFGTFRYLEDRQNWQDLYAKKTEYVHFYGTRFPYEVKAPKGWTAAPGMVAGVFAELKITSKDSQANVIVSPRRTADLAPMVPKYIKKIRRRYKNAKINVTPPEAGQTTSAGGNEALQVKLTVDDPQLGNEFSLTTFVVGREYNGEPMIYQIECWAPAEKAAVYQPAFAEILDNFQILDEVHVDKKEDDTELAMANKGNGDAMDKGAAAPSGPRKVIFTKSDIQVDDPTFANPDKARPSLDNLE